MPYSDPEKRRESDRQYKKRKRAEDPRPFMLNNAKERAKKKGLEFNITVDDIVIPDICPLLKIPIIQAVGIKCASHNSPSIDRIDNSLGYVKGNVIIISWRANRIKADASLAELQLLVSNLTYLVNNI